MRVLRRVAEAGRSSSNRSGVLSFGTKCGFRKESGCFCFGGWLCFFFILYFNVATFSSGWAFQGSFPFRFGVRGFLLYFFLLFLLLFTACLQLIHVLRKTDKSDVKARCVTKPLSAKLFCVSDSIL